MNYDPRGVAVRCFVIRSGFDAKNIILRVVIFDFGIIENDFMFYTNL